MSTVTTDVAALVASVRHLVPWVKGHLAQSEAQFNIELLQRTRDGYALPEWPENVDHFALQREARELRQQYLAGLVTRGKGKLASALTAWRNRGRE